MADGVHQFLLKPLPVLPQISIDHFDRFLDHFRAVWQERWDEVINRQVGPGARREAFVRIDEVGNVYCSEDWGAHAAPEWHLLLFHHNGKCEGHNELPLFMDMIGRGVGGRSSAGGGCSMALGSCAWGSGTATGISRGHRSRVSSWYLGTVCSRLEMGW